jgi:hypothetical protein
LLRALSAPPPFSFSFSFHSPHPPPPPRPFTPLPFPSTPFRAASQPSPRRSGSRTTPKSFGAPKRARAPPSRLPPPHPAHSAQRQRRQRLGLKRRLRVWRWRKAPTANQPPSKRAASETRLSSGIPRVEA